MRTETTEEYAEQRRLDLAAYDLPVKLLRYDARASRETRDLLQEDRRRVRRLPRMLRASSHEGLLRRFRHGACCPHRLPLHRVLQHLDLSVKIHELIVDDTPELLFIRHAQGRKHLLDTPLRLHHLIGGELRFLKLDILAQHDGRLLLIDFDEILRCRDAFRIALQIAQHIARDMLQGDKFLRHLTIFYLLPQILQNIVVAHRLGKTRFQKLRSHIRQLLQLRPLELQPLLSAAQSSHLKKCKAAEKNHHAGLPPFPLITEPSAAAQGSDCENQPQIAHTLAPSYDNCRLRKRTSYVLHYIIEAKS